jgi:hypothetical protein
VTPLTTIRVFGGYLLLLGAAGMLVPDALLRMLGMPVSHDAWPRIAAMLVLNYGLLYVWIVRTRAIAILPYTVFARILVLLYLGGFVAAGLVQPVILVFGIADAAGGLWTLWALRRDGQLLAVQR